MKTRWWFLSLASVVSIVNRRHALSLALLSAPTPAEMTFWTGNRSGGELRKSFPFLTKTNLTLSLEMSLWKTSGGRYSHEFGSNWFKRLQRQTELYCMASICVCRINIQRNGNRCNDFKSSERYYTEGYCEGVGEGEREGGAGIWIRPSTIERCIKVTS